ncbi:MAG: hypothetical protein BWX66_01225 [Deltaproteobacteria bacterium ADurb.Bin058]|nr:MAG: hypothetical protein BWX66_01225 [Deltaproteobacteria bacterium ADurb.Bin058]
MREIRFVTSKASALRAATSKAALEMSVAKTCTWGRLAASVHAMAPLPVPTSTTFVAKLAEIHVMAASTKVSVSGLGISVSGVT